MMASGFIGTDLAANQAGARSVRLLAERVGVRNAHGRLLNTVSREAALAGIRSGDYIPHGRTCVKYLTATVKDADCNFIYGSRDASQTTAGRSNAAEHLNRRCLRYGKPAVAPVTVP
jgi:hypothetical protein